MNGYNPFFNPYGQQFMPQPAQPPAPAQQVTRVNGENGARAYQIGPNSSALLLDESGVLVWLVTTDGAGYKTVGAYDIVPHNPPKTADYGDLESRIKRLEEIVNGNTGNPAANGKKQSEATAD